MKAMITADSSDESRPDDESKLVCLETAELLALYGEDLELDSVIQLLEEQRDSAALINLVNFPFDGVTISNRVGEAYGRFFSENRHYADFADRNNQAGLVVELINRAGNGLYPHQVM